MSKEYPSFEILSEGKPLSPKQIQEIEEIVQTDFRGERSEGGGGDKEDYYYWIDFSRVDEDKIRKYLKANDIQIVNGVDENGW